MNGVRLQCDHSGVNGELQAKEDRLVISPEVLNSKARRWYDGRVTLCIITNNVGSGRQTH